MTILLGKAGLFFSSEMLLKFCASKENILAYRTMNHNTITRERLTHEICITDMEKEIREKYSDNNQHSITVQHQFIVCLVQRFAL